MRYFSYNEPIWSNPSDVDEYGYVRILGNQIITVSEEEIRQNYFPYWEGQMIVKFGKNEYARIYSFLDCLDDFVVTHMAWEVTE